VVVHGGDLLYRSRVPAWLAEAALAPLKRLAESGVPVLLVPGNHERSRMPFPLLALHERLPDQASVHSNFDRSLRGRWSLARSRSATMLTT
jgi:DNA repair exonuclease SbcCD nuclease subunit